MRHGRVETERESQKVTPYEKGMAIDQVELEKVSSTSRLFSSSKAFGLQGHDQDEEERA
jgi:hypothetical protein